MCLLVYSHVGFADIFEIIIKREMSKEISYLGFGDEARYVSYQHESFVYDLEEVNEIISCTLVTITSDCSPCGRMPIVRTTLYLSFRLFDLLSCFWCAFVYGLS